MALPALKKVIQDEHADVPQLSVYHPRNQTPAPGSSPLFQKVELGNGFTGEMSTSFVHAPLMRWLEHLPSSLAADGRLIYRVRNRIYRIDDPRRICPEGICVKVFKTPSLLRSWHYYSHGSKAARAHRYAVHLHEHGVSTAEPIGYFEKWNGRRLSESYLLTEFARNATDLFSETNRLLCDEPDSAVYIELLRFAADSMRRMHDSGYVHRDLGGQNFMFERATHGRWYAPTFIDLNRGRLRAGVSIRERARDLAKLEVPSHFRNIFHHLYFGDQPPSDEFIRWEKWYRSRITLHNRTRKYRHPLREYRAKRTQLVVSTGKPSERDFWLWDDKSGQPSVVFNSKDRHRFRESTDWLKVAWSSATNARALRARYRSLRPEAFARPVDMPQRFGVAVEVAEDFPQQLELLHQTPGIPTFVRCYFHKGRTGLKQCADAVRKLHANGHEVSLGLIQSRQSVVNPQAWDEFIQEALATLHDKTRFVEIGHAVNRVKWGYWTLADMLTTFDQLDALRENYPHVKFLGPPVNDFEYHYYPWLLDRMGASVDGVSSHLYVDRRGQPENFQGRFSLVEKCILGRAIAEHWGGKRFYITETNWPLQGAKEYSPLAGAYTHHKYVESKLHVTPNEYADYMIRYALIALCSGMTERVWWWRLAAHGYGLADDLGGVQPRPAWHALVHFHRTVGSDRFVQRVEKDGAIWWHFEGASIAYSLGSVTMAVPSGYRHVTDVTGTRVEVPNDGHLPLTGSPLYFIK